MSNEKAKWVLVRNKRQKRRSQSENDPEFSLSDTSDNEVPTVGTVDQPTAGTVQSPIAITDTQPQMNMEQKHESEKQKAGSEHELGLLDEESYESESENYEDVPNAGELSMTDLQCGCCYELLVLPTTLQCGHNFCRLCLANWYFTSKKTECPVCRQMWHGCPKVNITLRTVLEKTCEHDLHRREDAVITQDAKTKISNFERSLSTSNQLQATNRLGFLGQRQVPQPAPQRPQQQANNFCTGVLFTGGLLLVVYLAWYWRNSDSHLLVYKPVERWDTDDVSQWLDELGHWTNGYVERAQEEKLDGRLLLAVNENYLEEKLNVTDSLHKRAILNALKDLSERGSKRPGNLWEYKSMHPGMTLLMLYGLKDFPRSFMVYLYIFEYDNIYLPLVHWACPPSSGINMENGTIYDTPTMEQQISLYTKWLCIPYWLFAVIAYDWTTSHYWVSRVVLANCLVLTLLEGMAFKWFFSGGYKKTPYLLTQYGKGLLSGLFFILVWPVVPSFICDCFFYIALYFSPFFNFEKLYKAWKSPEPRII